MTVKVSDIVARIDDAFPFERAEEWDAVGLLVGDPHAAVSGVIVTLDPTDAALERAREAGANVLVTHHPAFLTPPARLTPAVAPVAFAAARDGIALIAAHTNLDRDPGAADTLSHLLGIHPGRPVEETLLPVALVTVYVPVESESGVAAAMQAAGAGRIGEYRGCSFATEGTGRFTPSEDSSPAIGDRAEPSLAPEVRLEMVAAPALAGRVVRAARESHPYEEPLISVAETAIARGRARMGRLCTLDAPMSLGDLAVRAARTFGVTPRVWGDPQRVVSSMVTGTGSAGSLIGPARAAGADVLLGGEVRYHDALTAVESGLAVIEIGHDVSEWPLVGILAEAVLATDGLKPASVIVECPSAAWWTP